MDRFLETLPGHVRGKFRRSGIKNGQQFDPIEPIEPSNQLHLKRTERTVPIIEEYVIITGLH